jgi:hypothetical protein
MGAMQALKGGGPRFRRFDRPAIETADCRCRIGTSVCPATARCMKGGTGHHDLGKYAPSSAERALLTRRLPSTVGSCRFATPSPSSITPMFCLVP